jgi:hypothetical protein
MKSLTLVICALLSVSFAHSQTRMSLTIRDHPAGYATLSQKIQPDGSKTVELRLELTSANQKVKLTSEARYDAKGMPTRKFQEALMAEGKLQKQVIATFNKDGASVTLLDGGKRTMKNVPLVATAPRASLSEFWFIRDAPKPGQFEETYQFNTDTLEWDLVRTDYRGRKTLKIQGRSISVHEVSSKRNGKVTTAFLDDQGLPVLIDQGDVKMVKIWPK